MDNNTTIDNNNIINNDNTSPTPYTFLTIIIIGVHVFGDTGDLCKYSPNYFRCPASGPAAINVVQTIPKEAPAGQYDVIFSAKDGVCLSIPLLSTSI
jgi:hypothetical protein